MSTALTTLTRKRGPKPMPRLPCIAEGCSALADHPLSGYCEVHYRRVRRHGHAEATRRAKGEGTITGHGYVAIGLGADKRQAHVLIVERAIGRQIPAGAEVHHVNEIKTDNRHENLVVCPSRAYHKLLHVRTKALDECGNANFRKCPFCKQYDDPKNMTHNASSRYHYHSACKNEYRRTRRSK